MGDCNHPEATVTVTMDPNNDDDIYVARTRVCSECGEIVVISLDELTYEDLED